MNAQVTIKNIYGEDKIYPHNQIAQHFARIAGTKTLTSVTIGIMKSLGVSIEVMPQSL